MSNLFAFILCFLILPLLLLGLLGFALGWWLNRGNRIDGDLSVEGEGALRAEADTLRARVQELESGMSRRDGEVSDLKGKLAAAAAGAAAATAATATVAAKSDAGDDDDTYALEWRNRYLAARVKYLEGRLADQPAPKAKPKKKRSTAKKAVAGAALAGAAAVAAKPKKKAKAAPKKKAAPKPKAKAAAKPKPKVLYTDGPTDGAPDDLKLIKGIGPKFEKDLNSKGIYYFRQIAAWKKADVTMVEGVIDSIPGRIGRDEWVKQAKGLSKSSAITKSRKKPGPKPGTKRGALTASGKPRQKPGPKPGSTRKKAKPEMSEADKAFEKYYANVQKFDPKARRPVVKNIVKYCGIALQSRDSSLVACSDEAELQRVADGFVTKKLGKTSGQMDLVKDVCQEMKSERFKNRVTFYYLTAKKARKLGTFN